MAMDVFQSVLAEVKHFTYRNYMDGTVLVHELTNHADDQEPVITEFHSKEQITTYLLGWLGCKQHLTKQIYTLLDK